MNSKKKCSIKRSIVAEISLLTPAFEGRLLSDAEEFNMSRFMKIISQVKSKSKAKLSL
jgi:hypothetical protein